MPPESRDAGPGYAGISEYGDSAGDPGSEWSAGGYRPPAGMPKLIYHGPPMSAPPPAGWRPPHVVEPAPPRRLPEQDHAAIDEQEARARTLSLGFAIVAGAVMVIVLCAVCGRTLF
jgi:hypothetical protein